MTQHKHTQHTNKFFQGTLQSDSPGSGGSKLPAASLLKLGRWNVLSCHLSLPIRHFVVSPWTHFCCACVFVLYCGAQVSACWWCFLQLQNFDLQGHRRQCVRFLFWKSAWWAEWNCPRCTAGPSAQVWSTSVVTENWECYCECELVDPDV